MSQQTSRGQVALDDLRIIDADAHIFETVDDVLPYLEEKYDFLNKLVFKYEAPDPPYTLFSTSYAAPSSMSSYNMTNDAKTKLTEMTDFGIERGLLLPTLFNAIHTINNPRYAVALANAYNSWIQDEFLDEYDEFKAAIVIAAQKPDKAAEEIDDRASNDDFAAVALAPGGLFPPGGHERYDPIYESAERHGLPIVYHGTDAAMQSTFPLQYRWTETFAESHFITHPWKLMWNMGTTIFRGVPERFPDLKHVFAEAGLGYIPYVQWRLDDIYMEQSAELPWVERLPSEYMSDLYHYTTQPLGHAKRPTHIVQIINMIGSDRVMYSSDLPHPTFDPPEEFFAPVQSSFDAESLAGMMGGTAAGLFGF